MKENPFVSPPEEKVHHQLDVDNIEKQVTCHKEDICVSYSEIRTMFQAKIFGLYCSEMVDSASKIILLTLQESCVLLFLPMHKITLMISAISRLVKI